MNPKLNKRFAFGNQRVALTETSDSFSKTSVRDQAALLLSVADIAKSELTSGEKSLWKDIEDLPMFPLLLGSSFSLHSKTPREQQHSSTSLTDMIISAAPARGSLPSSRARTVSLDIAEHTRMENRTPSPVPIPEDQQVPVTPSPMVRKGLRVSARKRKQPEPEELEDDDEEDAFENLTYNPKSTGPLQGPIPKGITTKKIHRRKFSWKNYPEVSPMDVLFNYFLHFKTLTFLFLLA